MLEYAKIILSPLVTITLLISITFLIVKKDLFQLIKVIRIRFRDYEMEVATKNEQETGIIVEKKESILLQNDFINRISVTLVLSGFIKYEKREIECKEALKTLKIENVEIEGFGSNLIPKEGEIRYTRIHFFIFSDQEINPGGLKDVFCKHFSVNYGLSILDYIIFREPMIKA